MPTGDGMSETSGCRSLTGLGKVISNLVTSGKTEMVVEETTTNLNTFVRYQANRNEGTHYFYFSCI